MPVVILQKVETDNLSYTYPVGEHVLGRGCSLKCDSKKVSRKHGILKVTNDEGISLTSTHNNPFFYKTEKLPNISMLTFGNSIKLNNNDKISLCLDHGWFSILIKDEVGENTSCSKENETSLTDAVQQSSKRNLEDEHEENSPKKSKLGTAEVENNINETTLLDIKSEPVDFEPNTSTDVTNNNLESVKEEPIDNLESVKEEQIKQNEVDLKIVKTEVKEENVEVKKEDECKEKSDESKEKSDEPSTSGTNKKPWRDRCWYGTACYRKNGHHRLEFTHPGDSDFDSDPDDSRPICCYGADCYRKNREHRKRYRHPGQKKLGVKPPPPPPKRRVRRPPPVQDSEELDDYDLDDPFLDDGSEDEFEPSQDVDTESEYEESQDTEEDTKRLLKEARKFTRNK